MKVFSGARRVSNVLWFTFSIFALALLWRAFAGEVSGRWVSIHTPLNVEAFVAVSFLLLLLVRAAQQRVRSHDRKGAVRRRRAKALSIVLSLGGITGLVILAFHRSLSSPFLFDDYGHIALAQRAGFGGLLAAFYRPHADIFFRPLGFLTFALDLRWAHLDPFRWHLTSLTLHILCCWLVFVLLRQFDFSIVPSLLGAAIFALHGSRAESVCWTDARFDLLATLFVLLALVCAGRYGASAGGGRAWLAGASICLLLGLLSKESALSMPFLVLVLCWWRSGEERRRMLRSVPLFLAICAFEFAYRFWIIGGVGGYQTAGHPNVLSFSVLHSVKALLWREWAVLFFPVNWAAGVTVFVRIALALYLPALALVAALARVERRRIAVALLAVIAAGLPVQHLLLLEPDLAGARLLYLPVLGIALLWASVAEALAREITPLAAVLLLVPLFEFACLEANVSAWTHVAHLARQACRQMGEIAGAQRGPVEVVEPPAKRDGVFFLSDGFPDCVAMNSGVSAERIRMVDPGAKQAAAPGGTRYRWNERTLHFEREGQ